MAYDEFEHATYSRSNGEIQVDSICSLCYAN